MLFAHEEAVALEERIRLVRVKEEGVLVNGDVDGEAARDFGVSSMVGGIRPHKVAEARERMKTRKKGQEERVIVGGWGGDGTSEEGYVSRRKRGLAANGPAVKSHGPFEGVADKVGGARFADVGIKGFQLAANAGEIGLDGAGFNMMCFIGNEEREHVSGGLNGEVLTGTEGKVRAEGRAVG